MKPFPAPQKFHDTFLARAIFHSHFTSYRILYSVSQLLLILKVLEKLELEFIFKTFGAQMVRGPNFASTLNRLTNRLGRTSATTVTRAMTKAPQVKIPNI